MPDATEPSAKLGLPDNPDPSTKSDLQLKDTGTSFDATLHVYLGANPVFGITESKLDYDEVHWCYPSMDDLRKLRDALIDWLAPPPNATIAGITIADDGTSGNVTIVIGGASWRLSPDEAHAIAEALSAHAAYALKIGARKG